MTNGANGAAGAADASGGFDGSLLRRWAQWGARRPDWFVRVMPPIIATIVWAVASGPRRAIAANLLRVRPSRGPLRDRADVLRTFAVYASCLTDVLGATEDRPAASGAVVHGELHLEDALADRRGVILATAHTAGWEAAGPLLARDRHLDVMIVEAAERDPEASSIQDRARSLHGLRVAHVGNDPLAALPVLRHLRAGGVAAVQIDRSPRGSRSRAVTLFGAPGSMPEGPLRLAALTGAPILPVFAARTGHRRYAVFASPPIRIARDADDAAIDAAAQKLADCLEAFVVPRPTQWFHFRNE